jgi:hypothetical protein
LQDAAGDTTGAGKENKPPRAENMLENVPSEPKPRHVHREMENSGVEKLVGDELPNHPFPQTTSAQAQQMIHQDLLGDGQDLDENKYENIQTDEGFDSGNLDVSGCLEHGRKVISHPPRVHTKAGSHDPSAICHAWTCIGTKEWQLFVMRFLPILVCFTLVSSALAQQGGTKNRLVFPNSAPAPTPSSAPAVPSDLKPFCSGSSKP